MKSHHRVTVTEKLVCTDIFCDWCGCALQYGSKMSRIHLGKVNGYGGNAGSTWNVCSEECVAETRSEIGE
jgi:hypothetical protein